MKVKLKRKKQNKREQKANDFHKLEWTQMEMFMIWSRSAFLSYWSVTKSHKKINKRDQGNCDDEKNGELNLCDKEHKASLSFFPVATNKPREMKICSNVEQLTFQHLLAINSLTKCTWLRTISHLFSSPHLSTKRHRILSTFSLSHPFFSK